VKQEHEKETKVREFVKELFRVYLAQESPSDEEVNQYATEILSGATTLQATEDEFRLLSINVPKK
jgi:hypothetical protein